MSYENNFFMRQHKITRSRWRLRSLRSKPTNRIRENQNLKATWLKKQRKLFIISNPPVRLCDNRHCDKEDITLLIDQLTSHEQALEGLLNIWFKAFHSQLLAKFGDHRPCDKRGITDLIFPVKLQDYLVKRPSDFIKVSCSLYIPVPPSLIAISIVVMDISWSYTIT